MTTASDNLVTGPDGTPHCRNCSRPVGPDGIGTFDLPLGAGQSAPIATTGSTYVLRHHGCRSCGSLFDVRMVAADEAAGGPRTV